MKKRLLIIFIAVLFLNMEAMAHLDAIIINNIKGWEEFKDDIDFLWSNQHMYRYYHQKWDFDIRREEVVLKLESLYKKLDKIKGKNKKNSEYHLLMGDIAHYLYNLDITRYYENAITSYENAKKIESRDYRPFWFIGQHQSLSGHTKEGIASYREIIDVADPEKLDWSFWGDYSSCAMIGIMPLNFLMAFEFMNKNKGEFKDIKDEPYYKLYSDIKKRIVIPDNSKDYNYKDIWDKSDGEEVYMSRPLGIRFRIEEKFSARFFDYKSKTSSVIIYPKSEKEDAKIPYIIRIVVFSPEKNEEIGKYIKTYQDLSADFKKISMKNSFESENVYESYIADKNSGKGGQWFRILAVERNESEYPGVRVEYPLVSSNSYGLESYKGDYLGRFKGRMFYFILLQSTSTFSKQTIKKFENFVNNGLVLD